MLEKMIASSAFLNPSLPDELASAVSRDVDDDVDGLAATTALSGAAEET
jgi:hypothetical protein